MNNENEIIIANITGNDIYKNIKVCNDSKVERIVINSNCYNKTRLFVIADNEHLREIVINGEDGNSTLDNNQYLIFKSTIFNFILLLFIRSSFIRID